MGVYGKHDRFPLFMNRYLVIFKYWREKGVFVRNCMESYCIVEYKYISGKSYVYLEHNINRAPKSNLEKIYTVRKRPL